MNDPIQVEQDWQRNRRERLELEASLAAKAAQLAGMAPNPNGNVIDTTAYAERAKSDLAARETRRAELDATIRQCETDLAAAQRAAIDAVFAVGVRLRGNETPATLRRIVNGLAADMRRPAAALDRLDAASAALDDARRARAKMGSVDVFRLTAS